jgi:hypothetical protein
MRTDRLAVSIVAVLLAAVAPAASAGPDPQDVQLYPRPNSPLSELFKVQTRRPGTAATREPQVAPGTITTEAHGAIRQDFTPRVVCGMRMIEGTADMDPRIVIPIPERHGAKIRVLGPPPCDEVASGRSEIIQGGTFEARPPVRR